MNLRIVSLAIVICVVAASPLSAGRWRPKLAAEANRTAVARGETIVVTFSATNATSVQAFVNEFGQWIGWSDGVVMPATSGSFTVTPAVAGEFVITVAAWRRARDLNGDGKADGHRRSVTITIPITVR